MKRSIFHLRPLCPRRGSDNNFGLGGEPEVIRLENATFSVSSKLQKKLNLVVKNYANVSIPTDQVVTVRNTFTRTIVVFH